jgi:hypothetical protein
MLSQILPHVVIDCNAGLTPFQGMLSLTTMLALPTRHEANRKHNPRYRHQSRTA